jgi:glycosyltransferase involved in cell wall biosynthesis
MKILVVNQFFYPDHSAVSQQLTDLAEDLTAAGEQVSVICGRGAYSGGYAQSAHENYQGIEIHRVRSTGFGRRTMLGRITDMLAFYVTATWAMLRAPRPDVLYMISTPPLICVAGVLVGAMRGLPVVYGIHDLYPDIAVALGVLKRDSWITRLIDTLSLAAMRRMQRLIVLGGCAKDLIVAKGIPREKIVVLENWADPAQTVPVLPGENWFRHDRGLDGKFVVLYSGNMGLAHEFTTILDAAKSLAHRDDIVFLFIGDGARRREIEEYRDRHRLPNLRMEGYQDRGDLSYSLSSGDVFLISLRPGSEGLVLPCKVYAGMAVGRPLILVGSYANDTAATIGESGCGWIFAPGDSAGLAAKIVELRENPEIGVRYGACGRVALEHRYYRGHATGGYRRVFREALDAGK